VPVLLSPPVTRVFAALVIVLTVSIARAGADPQLNGRVIDENEAPVAGARITVRPAAPLATISWQTQTDAAGAFSLALPEAGDYLIDVQREGYYELKDRAIHIEAAVELSLVINPVREVFQSVDVNEQPSPVDIAEASNKEPLTGTEINDIPYPDSHSLRNSMKMLAGIVQDPGGGLHFNGSSENQVEYMLNGFDIGDPIYGEFQTTLAVEGIRSMDYSSGRYSPQFGQGTAGVLAISTENGTDAFHYTATDFVPGLQFQQGLRFGNWFPRFGVSGPIVRGHAWFSDTFQSEYTSTLITGLPAGQNVQSGWAGSNLLHAQVNPTRRNILYADFLVNINNQGRVGLGPLDPVSTTQTVDRREYFESLKDQYSTGRFVIEFGYAHNAFSTHQTPQGQSLYVFSPEGRGGNYFVTANQTSSRDQWLAHAYAPQFSLWGTHQIEAGVDADVLRYNGDFHRTGYEIVGLAGQVLSETSFTGAGVFAVRDTAMASWVLDTWRISKRAQITAGMREDWDQLARAMGWSPRIAFSWAPFAAGDTRVAGGFAVTHDAVRLDPFGRILDQTALTTEYGPTGLTLGPPVPTSFAAGSGLKLPRASTWSLGVDHAISTHVTTSLTYLRRRATDGFSFLNTQDPNAPPSLLPLPNSVVPGVFALTKLRRDEYDSIEVSVRQTFSGQHEWIASYTRSRAESNAVLDTTTTVPLEVLPDLVPMPWDSPNRLLAWAYLPLPWKDWSAAVLADARTGFPFSVEQQTGVIAGAVDSYRYPLNFDLNLAIERFITLRGYRFALRAGADNLTDHKNPTAVNNTVGSPQYLQFLGYEGRHYVLRIRFFGHAKAK